MQREVSVFLQDVLGAATEIERYIAGKSESEYLADGLTRRAVERCLEIIGEALSLVRRHDASVLAALPDAAKLIGLRNVLIHEYGRVDDQLIWEALRTRLPKFVTAVQQKLAEDENA